MAVPVKKVKSSVLVYETTCPRAVLANRARTPPARDVAASRMAAGIQPTQDPNVLLGASQMCSNIAHVVQFLGAVTALQSHAVPNDDAPCHNAKFNPNFARRVAPAISNPNRDTKGE